MVKTIDGGQYLAVIDSEQEKEVAFLIYLVDFNGEREVRELRLSGNYRFARLESSTWDLEMSPCSVWWNDELKGITDFFYERVAPICKSTICKKYEFVRF